MKLKQRPSVYRPKVENEKKLLTFLSQKDERLGSRSKK